MVRRRTIQFFLVVMIAGCNDSLTKSGTETTREDASPGFLDAGAVEEDSRSPPDCTYYAEPNSGSISNDGSIGEPWGSLELVLASGQRFSPGDVVCLYGGFHGALAFVDRNYSEDVVFVGLPGESARVSDIRIERSSGIVFDTIQIDASGKIDPSKDEKDRFIVRSGSQSHHISFLYVNLRSSDSIESWTKEDWYNKSMSGFDMRGVNIIIRYCRIENTYHAISLRGDNSELSHTVIDNFAGDAIRGLGSFSTYEFNTVRDAYVNDYAIQHDDLFQAFDLSEDPKIEGVVIRNNRFIQFMDPISFFVMNNDLISHDLQGIINTDGYADHWLVENNLVVVDHFHGISLYGARHSRVQNNTVVQSSDSQDEDVPWIRLTVQTKTGHRNFDNVIRNNLSARYTPDEYDVTSLVESNSLIGQLGLGDYERVFSDYRNQVYELNADSPAINAGTDIGVSDVDLAGNPRLRGAAVDTGAFEFQE